MVNLHYEVLANSINNHRFSYRFSNFIVKIINIHLKIYNLEIL